MANPTPPAPAPKISAPPVPAPKTSAPPAPAPQADAAAPGNAALEQLADLGFVSKLVGAGLRLSAADLESKDGVDLSALPQPVPGLRLMNAKWRKRPSRLLVDATLAVPHLETTDVKIEVNEERKVKFSGKLQKRLQLAALKNPEVSLSISEEGVFGGSVKIDESDLTPRGMPNLKVTGGGTLTIQGGLFTGNVDATLAYAKLGNGEVHFAVGEGGRITGTGKLHITPPFLNDVDAELALAEDGNLNGTVTVAMTETRSPIPALSLTAGTLSVSYINGAVSGSLTEFQAAYRGLADVKASASLADGMFSGEGDFALTVPGLKQASGKIRVRKGAVSGSMTLAASAFPEALPVKSGQITATLAENGRIGFAGNVGVELGPAGTGQLSGSYSETGELSLSATINLTVPGLQGAQVSVAYVNGDISGEAQVPIDPSLIPGLTGNATVRYQQGLWSGDTELAFEADNGKLSGRIRVTVAQTEAGTLQLGGSGQVEAQIAPRLRGMLTATILPEGGVDVSGQITVTEPLELFPEAKFDKELFKYSQNIPLWAILVAVIRVRAGIRGGVGPGVFRNITVEGSYTFGSEAADPTFSISGEMFIPAFIEAYVAFGAGLGIDVVIGELTGGLEGVATAGLYGAISVVPELSYADGDWSIEGDATLAAGARLKLGLNAWVEVEAFWVTVWEETWKLGEWAWNVGPDLGLQAHMAYRFGQPGPPELDFKSSDIDTESMIQAAMPEDGPAPSGAKEALDNKAEWKGKLKEQKPAPLPPDLAAQSQAAPPAPPQPAQQPKPKSGPPSGGPGPPAPGGAPGQATPEAAAPPGSPAAEQAAADAATPDPSAKGAVPASEVPGADQPRFSGPITLATLDEPPVPLPRTKEQEVEDVKAAEKAIRLAAAQTKDTDALDDWFPRIKNRFRLVSLGYAGDFKSGFRIEGGINPQIEIEDEEEELKGKNLTIKDNKSADHATNIVYETATVGGSKVGVIMTADPLGPDHPLGSEAGGQKPLMDQLPTDPDDYPKTNHRFVRGHLLNYDLGGPGKDLNLFPITSQANSQHSNKVEETVKKWVNENKLWVRYIVKVASSGELVALKGTPPLKAIDSRLEINVATLNTDLKPVKTYSVQIPSEYDPDRIKKGEDTGLDPAKRPKDLVASISETTPTGVKGRAIDKDVEPQIYSKQDPTIFPETMRADLAYWHTTRLKTKGTKELIQTIPYIKEARTDALYEAYEEAQRRSPGEKGRDISDLDDDVLQQFNVVKGLWGEVVKAVEKKLKT